MPLREELEHSGTWLFKYRSFLPLLVIILFIGAFQNFEYPYQNKRLDYLWGFMCMAFSFIGLGIRMVTLGSVPKGTSGRNTRRVKAAFLNTSGMYSLVRHPLYFGNFVVGLGMSFYFRLWWFSVIYVLIFWLYYERIIFAEEEFLRREYGEGYLKWAKQTPAFIPRMGRWKSPALPFSLRIAVKGEYRTFTAITTSYAVLAYLGGFFAEGKFRFDFLWTRVFGVGLAAFFIIRILHKHTALLKVKGR
jgi:protein-S-isoprenylcysteine O-methyltransferase Ste14